MLGLNLSNVICFLNILIFIHCESIYTVIAPGTIRSYFKYSVAVTLNDAQSATEIEVGITGAIYNATQWKDVQPLTTEIFEFDVPKLERDNYNLTIRDVTNNRFENSTTLKYVEYKPLVIMQTDKAIYKPGDLVRFRVLFLNEHTQPAKFNESISILLKDGDKNRIQIWKNINSTQGVFTGSFQLSEQTVLGIWTIEVNTNDAKLNSKTFEVDRYALPRFQVNIETIKNVAVSDEFIKVIVRAKYTFGKPVKGKATVTIKPQYGVENLMGIKKMLPINGKAYVEFNIKEEVLNANMNANWISERYTIYAEVEEELTESVENETYDIVVHQKDYTIESEQQKQCSYPGEMIELDVSVKHMDGSPVQDVENPIQLTVNDTMLTGMLDKNGIATFNLACPESEFLHINCSYLNFHEICAYISLPTMDDYPLELILNTKKQRLGKDVLVKVKWSEPINAFTYTVTARGNIVKAATVKVNNKKKRSYNLKFEPTHDMIPEAIIYVQYIYNNNLRFKEEVIQFRNAFENTLNITTTKQASPGDDIEFHISTDPHSFVGLLGVDQSVLLLKDGNDISKNDIFADLREYHSETPAGFDSPDPYPGRTSGLVTLTNANYPYAQNLQLFTHSNKRYHGTFSSSSVMSRSAYVRKNFVESWIFENFETKNQSSIDFTKKIPDILTSWVITGFSLNAKTGIALTQNPTKIQVYKPFFISVYLPYAVKQGEIIAIPVLVFNYMNSTLETEVIMYNSDEEYEFTEATNDVETRTLAATKRSKCLSIPTNSVGNVAFLIKPKTIGLITIKVNALSALAGDAIEQSLKVEPEGITQYENHAFFINLSDKQEQSESVSIDIPDNAVPNSEHIEISTIGDLVGLTIKNIENLVRTPIGYGEQNMINFVPSILVLEYLQTIKQSLPNVTENALRILQLGFQRELKFKLEDGSFCAFEGDSSGSTWLTAYIARSFQQASKFIYIDSDLITNALDFLVSKQTISGSFAEFGQLVNSSYTNDVAFSAFVLLAFVDYKDNDSNEKYRACIERGVRYLLQYLDDTDDMQSLSLIALILQEVKHPLADDVLSKINNLAKNENGYMWWTNNSKKHKKATTPDGSDVEITSYILQAMLEKGYTADLLPIIKWLIMQRNSMGGFVTTRDTVTGLQALIKFAKKTGLSQSGTMHIEYALEGIEVDEKRTLTIDSDNYMILSTNELPKNTRKVKFTAKGNTSALLQVSYQYNTLVKKPQPSFELDLNVRQKTSQSKKLTLEICVKFTPANIELEGNKTNLVVIEATLPSGYATNQAELDALRDFKTILFTETKKSDSIAIIYLKGLEANKPKCISIDSIRIHEIAKQRPVPVVIYDYYNRERSSTEYYEITTSLCDICRGAECGVICKKNKEMSDSSSDVCV